MSANLELKTLAGLSIDEMYVRLDEQLPAGAYKPIAGTHGKDGNELTDIDPNYATEVLNLVFGPCGLGWGYTYSPGDLSLSIENRPKSSGQGTRRVCLAVLTRLSVWYKLVKPGGEEVLCQIEAGGASDNDDEAYALKGAITYAIGNALSKIGWQRSVYLGLRSHRTVKAAAPAAKANTPAPTGPSAALQPASTQSAAAEGKIEELEEKIDPAGMDLKAVLAYTVPAGSWKGKTFSMVIETGDLGQKVIDFWTRMEEGSEAVKRELKGVALRYRELSKSDHRVPEPA